MLRDRIAGDPIIGETRSCWGPYLYPVICGREFTTRLDLERVRHGARMAPARPLAYVEPMPQPPPPFLQRWPTRSRHRCCWAPRQPPLLAGR
jgi:hypothetical protein